MDGERLYNAFAHGARELIKEKRSLNRINVFPVADNDTGNNMAHTARSMVESTEARESVSVVGRMMAEAALTGARGNSGIIFAQFLQGMSEGIGEKQALTPKEFVRAVRKAVDFAYGSTSEPVEGTILTVMKDWSVALRGLVEKRDDFVELLSSSIGAAKSSLRQTPERLRVLKEEGVVDAGAKGFVIFLEGLTRALSQGKEAISAGYEEGGLKLQEEEERHMIHPQEIGGRRYCTEVLIGGEDLDREEIREFVDSQGDSTIVAGSKSKVRVHLHTDSPAETVFWLEKKGEVLQQKVDDMKRQHDMVFDRQSSIALVTDSTCDLPQSIMDRFQIHMVPLNVAFGTNSYLDKRTITPRQFYRALDEKEDYPSTSQPSMGSFIDLYRELSDNYDSVVSIHIADKLSGTYRAARSAAQKIPQANISVIDSRNLTSSLGLIVWKVAQAIADGASHEEAVRLAESCAGRAKVLVSVRDLKYMIRGGRVSPLKGFFARLMGLKPIISLDEEGNSELYGKAFSFAQNNSRIIEMLREVQREKGLDRYAIGHAHASDVAAEMKDRLERALGQPASYVMEISPLIGAHSGVGAISVSYLSGTE